ncbi:MAG: glutaredoxin, partial [Chloroflexota bacterium]|nr:glutaredoxin [Chloroflexota bacterium]
MTIKLLNNEVIEQVQEVFDGLSEPVQVLFFGKGFDCDYCEDTLQLVREVVDISDKLELTEYDIDEDAAIAGQYNIDKAPGLVIAGLDGEQILDYGIRFAGIPSGHEFSSLINTMLLVSARDSGLNQETREFLQKLNQPVQMLVFVTPSCPYCPRSVILAHQMALESPMIEAEMIEAT